MSVKAVLFDLFGVLFKDRWKEWIQENEITLRKFVESGPPLQELGLLPSYPQYYSDLIRINTNEKDNEGNPIINDDIFYQILEKASNEPAHLIKAIIHDTETLNKDLLPVINNLKEKGYKIGVITNGDEKITKEFLNAHNLISLFDIIVNSSGSEKQKPGYPIFNEVSSQLSISFNEILLIDDSIKVVNGASELGINAIHYCNQTIEELQQEIANFL